MARQRCRAISLAHSITALLAEIDANGKVQKSRLHNPESAMTCSSPDCAKKIFARGLCQACYYRLRRNGTVARKNVRRAAHCIAPGCAKPVLGRNLCITHYRALEHPLKGVWKTLRHKNPGQTPAHWNAFDAFLTDVGDRPSTRHRLKRRDPEQPFSKENVYWRPPADPQYEGQAQYQAAYGRDHNIRKFGITPEDYERMRKEQDGACAICGQPETKVHHRTGALHALAIDHDHATGEVRGLLCNACNTALGLFDDDLRTLEAAAAYLRRHAPA